MVETDVDLKKPASIVGRCPGEVDGVYELQGPVHDVIELHNYSGSKGVDHTEPPSTTIHSVAIAGTIDWAQLVIWECVFEIAVHGELKGIPDLLCPLSVEVLRLCVVWLINSAKNGA